MGKIGIMLTVITYDSFIKGLPKGGNIQEVFTDCLRR